MRYIDTGINIRSLNQYKQHAIEMNSNKRAILIDSEKGILDIEYMWPKKEGTYAAIVLEGTELKDTDLRTTFYYNNLMRLYVAKK